MLRGSRYGRARRDGYMIVGHHSGLPRYRFDYNDHRSYAFHNLPPPTPWTDDDMPRNSRYSNPRHVNTQARHVRGKGVVVGKRLLPRKVRANVRIGQCLPQKITTETRTELRTPAGQQGVVTMISQRKLPTDDRTGMMLADVNRKSDGTWQFFDQYNSMETSASTTSDISLLTHRRDWTMFTNPSWRDGMAFINARFITTAQNATGYIPACLLSNASATTAGRMIDSDGIGHIECEWFKTAAPSQASTTVVSAPGGIVSASTAQVDNYYHIMEELSWSFVNNGDVPVAVTIYEFILNRDVYLGPSKDKGTPPITLPAEGGLPCPLELWRQSREQAFEVSMTGTEIGTTANDASVTAGERETPGATVQNMGDAGPVGVATAAAPLGGSSVLDTDPLNPVASGSGAPVSDIDAPGVTPKVAHLLHTWYKVRTHTRRLGPGQNTTITIHVRFNKKIPGSWYHMLYGVKGLTRCFALVTRPDPVTGMMRTALGAPILNTRQEIMGPTDLLIKFWKTKQMAKTPQKIRGHRYFRAAQPAFTSVFQRDPADGDDDNVDPGNGEMNA